MQTQRLQDQWFEPPDNPDHFEGYAKEFIWLQKNINWWTGDLARTAGAISDDILFQTFPVDASPGHIARCRAVAEAYPTKESRNPGATWSQHKDLANDDDRTELLAWIVNEGLTTDEARAALATHRKAKRENKKARWLLAVDVNYFIHRFWYSGAGVESAVGVSDWIERTAERLKEKGLTDLVCCFDDKVNHRKELTKEWDAKYKDRPPKDPELGQQIGLTHELLEKKGITCIKLDGMEADDCLASYAYQFAGKVTLLTQDKDCRQCLSKSCNMLLDVEWLEDETSGEMLPHYKWLSEKDHTKETDIPPHQWTEYQAIWGDNCDGIKGAVGIGAKGAKDVILEFGTIEAAIEAAKAEDERLKPKQRKSLIEFEDNVDVTRKLVTLKTNLPIPMTTRLA